MGDGCRLFFRARDRQDVDDDAGPVPAHLVVPRVQPRAGPGQVAYVLTLAERHYGAAWYYAPARWGTADGYVPWDVFLVTWESMQAQWALDRAMGATAALIGHADPEQAQRIIDQDIAAAFPGG